MGRTLAVAAVLLGGGLLVALLATGAPAPAQPATAVKADPPAPPLAKGATRAEHLRAEALPPPFSSLVAIAQPKLPPGEHDWLAAHEEAGQSLAEHREDCTPVKGRVVYLVPTGPFTPEGTALLARLAPLLAAHFQLELKQLPPLDAKVAGRSERQRDFGPQWLTEDILGGLLAVKPADAAAVMAVTMVDLYPAPDWNFVFGQASYTERVGVTSLFRSGDLQTEPALVLKRTWATSMHEIGHMLQLLHCVAWECPMNGTNHQEEADSRPLEPCPHCLAKLHYATGLDPETRWAQLRAAFADAGLARGVQEIDRATEALRRVAPAAGPR